MKSSRKHGVRKQRGRPATGQDPVTAIRLSSEMRENVDAWSARQSDEPGRSEAIRRLVELGLASARRTGARTNKAAKASELAGQEIDRLSDPSATDEERQLRKRRLLKGPKEFRDIRTVFQHACKMGLEGIVSKRLGSRYRSGRSPDWLKFKNSPAVRRERICLSGLLG